MQNSKFTLSWLNRYKKTLSKIFQLYFVATSIMGVVWYTNPSLNTLPYLSGLAGLIGLGLATFCFIVLAKMFREDAKASSSGAPESTAGFDTTAHQLYLVNGISCLLIGVGTIAAFWIFK